MSNAVPEGWRSNTIGECCNILDSQRIPLNSEERAIRQGDYPYYGANGIQGFIDDFIFEGDAILVAEDGGNFDQYEDRPIAQWVTGKYWVNNHAHILRAKENDLDKWIYFSLVHKNILNFINGGTRAKLNQSDLREIDILLPPLSEQKKIASILTSVDEVIENTQKQIEKLQDLKKATMNELLTKGIGHTEFKDSELGRIPKSWEVVRFQEVFESYTYGPRFSSKDYSPIGNVKTIRGTDLTKDWSINYKQVPLADLDEKVVSQHRLKENDIVMITTADCGFSAVFKEQLIPFIASAYAIRLRPTLRINSSFCVCYLQTSIAKDQIEKYERKGTVSNLPGSDVMNVRLSLPSLNEQSEIVSALTSIDTNISNNLEKLVQTQSLKKSLMQDLLTGKVRVQVN